MSRAENINVPLLCLGEAKKPTLKSVHDDVMMRLGVDMAIGNAESSMLQSIDTINRRILGNFAFDIGASDMSAERKSATLIEMLQCCSGVCQPHRTQTLRKHVHSREVEVGLLE